MKRLFLQSLTAVVILSLTLFATPSCTKSDSSSTSVLSKILGWLGDTEQLDSLEQDIKLDTTTTKTGSVSLLKYFPPIGDQGQYGTCVAWAVGYNFRTALYAKEKSLTSTQLAQTQYQFSPKDLYLSIPSSGKGTSCNGSQFENALDELVSRGIATLATVPYDNLGDCSGSPESAWTTEASKYKIKNYRKVDIDVNAIRSYLSEGRPVIIGAKLGDNFMKWSDDQVISSDTYAYAGQHAYHAMIICGYDDSKGSNGAFRVVNSWGTSWGNSGYIWVDYKFFVNSFCFAAFTGSSIVENPVSTSNPNTVATDQIATGTDLVAWELSEKQKTGATSNLERTCTYNVFNSGTTDIAASSRWNILYVYYNAYNANEYGVLLYDYYTDQYGSLNEDGELTTNKVGLSGNWWNYFNIPSGKSVASVKYGDGYVFEFDYTMPTTLNGKYYLVLIADGYNAIDEVDEDNNYYFLETTDGNPITIKNGVIDESNISSTSKKSLKVPYKFAPSPKATMISKTNVNTYSPQEITTMLKHHKETGELRKKALKYLANKPSTEKRFVKR